MWKRKAFVIQNYKHQSSDNDSENEGRDSLISFPGPSKTDARESGLFDTVGSQSTEKSRTSTSSKNYRSIFQESQASFRSNEVDNHGSFLKSSFKGKDSREPSQTAQNSKSKERDSHRNMSRRRKNLIHLSDASSQGQSLLKSPAASFEVKSPINFNSREFSVARVSEWNRNCTEYDRYPPSNPVSRSPSIDEKAQIPYGRPLSSLSSVYGGTAYDNFNSEANKEDTNFRDSFNIPDNILEMYNLDPTDLQDLNMFVNDKEFDDVYHDPNIEEPKKPFKDRLLDWHSLGNIIFLILLLGGSAIIFIFWPVYTFGGKVSPPRNIGEFPDRKFPILKAVPTSLIDSNTPKSAHYRQTFDSKKYKLVFSDEFEDDNRSFYEGDDVRWQAMDIWYGATQDLEWYSPDMVTTKDGSLQLKMENFANHNLKFMSGMIQSWNKLCFKGGIIEISASLGGLGDKSGLWPGLWTLGNLGRPGYRGSTDGVWPYAYDSCNSGITPNQSASDGLSYLPGQRLSKCTCVGEDHPSPGKGRGAPEIDIVEGTVSEYDKQRNKIGVVSQSGQFAPFDPFWYANYKYIAVYNTSLTTMNGWTGGPFQQALSGVTTLNAEWYEGKGFQKYAFEYKPGGIEGFVHWYVGDKPAWSMLGAAVGPNGNVGQREISQEPMSIIMNLGISPSWTYIDWPAMQFPATMYIDYVRIYQDPKNVIMTCDPPGYPTTDYIKDHPIVYNNANITSWSDAGYDWPKNSLMHGCKSS